MLDKNRVLLRILQDMGRLIGIPFTKRNIYTTIGTVFLFLLLFMQTKMSCHEHAPFHGFFYGHSCVIISGGHVRCWGGSPSGELGYGHTNAIGDDESPASAGNVDVGGTVTQLAASENHTCALLMGGAVTSPKKSAQSTLSYGGSVRCWGYNGRGQLGYGHTNAIGDDESPASAGDVNVGETVIQIATGRNHTCALLTDGSVRCWGYNGRGQLGYGHTNTIGDDESPASAGDVNVGETVIQIATGRNHTCALLTDGSVRCWGYNGRGQLGYGHTNTIGDDESPASAGM